MKKSIAVVLLVALCVAMSLGITVKRTYASPDGQVMTTMETSAVDCDGGGNPGGDPGPSK